VRREEAIRLPTAQFSGASRAGTRGTQERRSLSAGQSGPGRRSRPHTGCRCRGEERSLSKKLYVGNIPFTATEDALRALFEKHGEVRSVSVISDRETGRPRGFAFVEMAEASAAQDAIQALDGSEFGGRDLRVNEAQDRRAAEGGGGDGYRRGR
jgi:RNA recognition motif-containing protein